MEPKSVDRLLVEYGYTPEEFSGFSYELVASEHREEKGILLSAFVYDEQMSLLKWWNGGYDRANIVILYAVREFFHAVAVKIQQQRITRALSAPFVPAHSFTKKTVGKTAWDYAVTYGTSTTDAINYSAVSSTDGTYH